MWRSFFTERKWLLWSWGGALFIILSLFSQTWIDVKINEWYKGFTIFYKKLLKENYQNFMMAFSCL
jgi:peptide/bleomycin uptake transporter